MLRPGKEQSMKKLIEALNVIQEECKKHRVCGIRMCNECPLSGSVCKIHDEYPDEWEINEPQKALR